MAMNLDPLGPEIQALPSVIKSKVADSILQRGS